MSIRSPATVTSKATTTAFATRAALLALCVLLAVVPWLAGSYAEQLGYRVLQLYVLAAAWDLLAGYTGQTSLGVAAFVGCGAYMMAELSNTVGLPVPLLLAASALAAAALAALLSVPIFRLRGLYFTIGTLALAEALRIVMVNVALFGGTTGLILQRPPLSFSALYGLALALALLTALTLQLLLRSPLSLALRAVRDDEDVAAQMGVRTLRVKALAFVISAALTGVIGGLQALKLGAIEPYGAFGLNWTLDALAAAIIGGQASRLGPWLGALLYVGLGESLQSLPALHGAVAGLIVLVIVRCWPQGLAGWVRRYLRRPASTEAIPDV